MIKQPWLAALSGLLLLFLFGYILERIWFLSRAERSLGSVIELRSANSRCGGGRRSRSYSCTKFSATIQFATISGEIEQFVVSAGSSRGHDQPVSNARLRSRQGVKVIYDPSKPSKAYEDTLWGVWAGPIMLFIGQLLSFFSSFFEPRRRRLSF